MKRRWVAAGLLEAERSFRRVKGGRQISILVAALRRPTGAKPTGYDEAAA